MLALVMVWRHIASRAPWTCAAVSRPHNQSYGEHLREWCTLQSACTGWSYAPRLRVTGHPHVHCATGATAHLAGRRAHFALLIWRQSASRRDAVHNSLVRFIYMYINMYIYWRGGAANTAACRGVRICVRVVRSACKVGCMSFMSAWLCRSARCYVRSLTLVDRRSGSPAGQSQAVCVRFLHNLYITHVSPLKQEREANG